MKFRQFKFILAFFSVGLLFFFMPVNAHAAKSTTTPTIFLHGLQGTHKSTDQLISAAEKDGAKKVLTINVQSDGSLQTIGKYSTKNKRPLIQINFENNATPISTQVNWLTTILQDMKKIDHIKKFNVVAHSAGNLTLFETMSKTANQNSMPKLNKYVDLAGPFNGVLGMGDSANQIKLGKDYKPSSFMAANSYYPSFQELMQDASSFPKNIKILCVYGNLNDGTNSDGLVSTQSVKSLNYLLRNRHAKITNLQMNGLTHSGLHKSTRVDQKMIKFLWK